MIKKGIIDENTPPDQPNPPDKQAADGTDKFPSGRSPADIDHPSTRAAEAAKAAQQKPVPAPEPDETTKPS